MLMSQGHLRALAVTASSYSTGQHVTFYEADDDRGLSPWTRSQRIAVRTTLNTQHLLASSAIPFVFPAIQLPIGDDSEWFGDGSMRQAAPISPAVHLGANRILIIGAGRMHEPPGPRIGPPGRIIGRSGRIGRSGPLSGPSPCWASINSRAVLMV